MARKFLGIFVFVLFFGAWGALGQSVSTEPVPEFRLSANLVVLDVVATDSHRNPVHGLTASDFTLREDGRQQAILHFEEHRLSENENAPVMPLLQPGVFTNYTPTPASGAMNVLLFDALNTPLIDWELARSEVEKYLKSTPPNGRMAIFALTSRLRMLQNFTSNPERLRASLDSQSLKDLWTDTGQEALPLMHRTVDPQQAGYGPEASRAQIRVLETLDAFNQLGRYLSGLPGRKNLLWISASFPVSLLEIGGFRHPPFVAFDADRELRETTDLLRQSQVSVYPIDARGLMAGGGSAARAAHSAKDQTAFLNRLGVEHNTMKELAEGTGGEVFANTNGIAEAIGKSVEDGANYYTIAYVPTNQRWNGHLRKIEIKLDRKGLELAYRHGYYADNPNAPVRPVPVSKAGSAPPRDGAVDDAMKWGSPGPTQILFAATVKPLAGIETGLAPGNRGMAKIKGPYRQYSVDFDVNQRQILCPAGAGGDYACVLDSMVFVYDAAGRLVNLENDRMRMSIPAAQAARLQHSIAHFQRVISVPAKGDYFLRIGVRDVNNGHIGALEVPVAEVSKLPVG